jgi:arsenate reductase
MSNKERVLFICEHNAGRSQIAEGLLRTLRGDRYDVASAGTEPASQVNPLIIEVMREIGIDITGYRPKPLISFMDSRYDRIVVLCECRGTCTILPQADRVEYRIFSDPYQYTGSDEERKKKFRELRDAIKAWIENEF